MYLKVKFGLKKGGQYVDMSKQKKHNVKKQRQLEILVAYYKRNPDIFIERELGVKLTKWQRFILRHMRFKNGTESR